MTPRTRLIILTSPHNPTSAADRGGRAASQSARIAEAHGAHVLVDEVYLDASHPEMRPAATLGDRFISTSSLTKSYGLSSLRCGWAIASPAVAERIRRARDVIDGNGAIPAERLATLAFAQIDRLIERARSLLTANTRTAASFLDAAPELEYVDPNGGTVVFPRLRGVTDASRFVERLGKEYDLAVAPGHFFDAPAHFRLGIGGATRRRGRGTDATPLSARRTHLGVTAPIFAPIAPYESEVLMPRVVITTLFLLATALPARAQSPQSSRGRARPCPATRRRPWSRSTNDPPGRSRRRWPAARG